MPCFRIESAALVFLMYLEHIYKGITFGRARFRFLSFAAVSAVSCRFLSFRRSLSLVPDDEIKALLGTTCRGRCFHMIVVMMIGFLVDCRTVKTVINIKNLPAYVYAHRYAREFSLKSTVLLSIVCFCVIGLARLWRMRVPLLHVAGYTVQMKEPPP